MQHEQPEPNPKSAPSASLLWLLIQHFALFVLLVVVLILIVPKFEFRYRNTDMLLPGITQSLLVLSWWIDSYGYFGLVVPACGMIVTGLLFTNGSHSAAREFTKVILALYIFSFVVIAIALCLPFLAHAIG